MIIGVTIVKETLFRMIQQPFSNTYFFTKDGVSAAPSEAIVDEIVLMERQLHNTVTNFKKASVWTAGGTPAQNQIIFEKNLTGTGNNTPAAAMDRERAVLVQWPAGFNIKGAPVYLRKWYHAGGNIGANTITGSDQLANTAPIAQAARDGIATICDSVYNVGADGSWKICAKSGREATGPQKVHPYLEHHQMGDQWR